MENGYYTHRPYLKQELDSLLSLKKDVKVLEFGTGDGSSEVLNQYAQNNPGLSIIGFESDKAWYDSMKGKYELPNYQMIFVEDWDKLLETYAFNQYDLVFVDQGPTFEVRMRTIDRLIDSTRTIILHDYDYYNRELQKIEDIYSFDNKSYFGKYLDKFNIKGYSNQLPPTLVFNKII